MNSVIHVNDDQFEEVVLKAELPVLVDFWAPWCGPCRMVAPLLDKLRQSIPVKSLWQRSIRMKTANGRQLSCSGYTDNAFYFQGASCKNTGRRSFRSGLKNLVNDFLAGKN
jgi:thioredoxin 1